VCVGRAEELRWCWRMHPRTGLGELVVRGKLDIISFSGWTGN
jgi:hypothetical protein